MSLRHVVIIMVVVTLVVVIGACKKSDQGATTTGTKTGAPGMPGPGGMRGPGMKGGMMKGGMGGPGMRGGMRGGMGGPGAMRGGMGGAGMRGGMGGPAAMRGGMGGSKGGASAAPAATSAAPSPGGAKKLTDQALALKHKGDYKRAAVMFDQAIDADGRDAAAHWGMAWTMAQLGRKNKDKVMLDRAKEEFTRFMTLSKDSGKIAEAKAAVGRLGGGS